MYISEPCHIYESLRIFRAMTYLKPGTYSEPSQRFKMEFFEKIVKNYNYFSKALIFPTMIIFPLTGL